MTELEEQIRDELLRLKPIVETITGLSSRWSGVVELVPDADFKGKKPFSCHILMQEALAHQEVRWRTSIHELLHSISAGYLQSDYMAWLGWEEGVVEQLQRLIRPEVLERLGVTVEENIFREWEAVHPFNRHIAALEQIRTTLHLSEVSFYLELLRTPIRERPAYALGLRDRLEEPERTAFVRIYSLANAVLRR